MFECRKILTVCALAIAVNAPVAYAKDTLLAGEMLLNDQFISSPNGRYKLIMQLDGSLVMYRSNGTIRYAMAKRGTHAVMQADGNFVEYRANEALWHTGTWDCCAGHTVFLLITDEGNLMVVKRYESSSYSYAMPVWEIGNDTMSQPSTAVYPVEILKPPGIRPTNPPPKGERFNIDNSIPSRVYSRY